MFRKRGTASAESAPPKPKPEDQSPLNGGKMDHRAEAPAGGAAEGTENTFTNEEMAFWLAITGMR